jgi:hypothetical protein
MRPGRRGTAARSVCLAIARAAMVSAIAVTLIGLSGPARAGADPFLWSSPLARAPADDGDAPDLTNVACPSLSQCTAIALDDHQGTWRMQASALPVWALIGNSSEINRLGLAGLACPTRSRCTAVAEGGEAVTFRPTSPTRPPRTEVDNLASVNAIACPSADQCTLVDSSGFEVTFNPRAPHDRSSQEISPGNGFLFGVACPAVTQCTAVDEDGSEVTFDPRAPQRAKPVQIDTTSAGDDLPPFLQAVACSSTSQCTAVDIGGSEVTFNPTAPAGSIPVQIAAGHSLRGVACPAASQCTAVDLDGGEETFDPAAPMGVVRHLIAKGQTLTSVACPAIDECVTADADHILIGLPIRVTTESDRARATDVRLSGRIEARGQQVTWRFQFGSSTAYGKYTRRLRLDSTGGAAGVSSTLAHLRPSTVYHARLVVTTVSSNAPTVTAYGRDLTFKTERRRR